MTRGGKCIPVPPGSVLAMELEAASGGDRSLELDTGDTVYEVYVTAVQTTPPSSETVARSIAGIKAAAGSWKDVDVAGFRTYLAERRRLHPRPAVRL